MSSARDAAIVELARRANLIDDTKLDQARAAQCELKEFGIIRSIDSLLLEKRLTSKHVVDQLLSEVEHYSIRCRRCGSANQLLTCDRQGVIKCVQCTVALEYESSRLTNEDLWRETATLDKDANALSACFQPPAGQSMARNSRSLAAGAASISRYQVGSLLGPCSVGISYHGTGTSGPVLLKVLDLALLDPAGSFEDYSAYVRSIDSQMRLSVLRPFLVFRELGLAYTSRPMVGGDQAPLQAKLLSRQDSLLPLSTVQQCALKVLSALREFHSARVVHGNISPSNILFHEGNTYLTDAGTHILIDALPPETRAIYLYCKQRYTAPEVLAGGEHTYSSDVYAAGIALLELLDKSLRAPDDMLESIRDVISKMTASDLSLRYESAKEAIKDLESVSLRPRVAVAPRNFRNFERSKISSSNIRWLLRRTSITVCSICLLLVPAWQVVSWKAGSSSLVSADVESQVTRSSIEAEVRRLTLWTVQDAASYAEAFNAWSRLLELVGGTPLEDYVSHSMDKALQAPSLFMPAAVVAGLSEAESMLESGKVRECLRIVINIQAVVGDIPWVCSLRDKAAEKLKSNENMSLLCVSSHQAINHSQERRRYLLVSRSLATIDDIRRLNHLWPGPKPLATSLGNTAITNISLVYARELARKYNRRIMTIDEWKALYQTYAFTDDNPFQNSVSSSDPQCDLYEWVEETSPDSLSQRGYGTVLGAARNNLTRSNLVRRERARGYEDVSCRLVEDLFPIDVQTSQYQGR